MITKKHMAFDYKVTFTKFEEIILNVDRQIWKIFNLIPYYKLCKISVQL